MMQTIPMAMFDHVSKKTILILFLLLQACNETKEEYSKINPMLDHRLRIKNKKYHDVYKQFSDTLNTWAKYKIFGSLDSIYSINNADSLLCFNKDENRLVVAVLNRYVSKKVQSNSDGMYYFYGENIGGFWYFFRGPFIVIPRSMVKDHPINKSLSYQQLHQIALKEVYGGYLKADGSINEEWFISQFEGNDWGNFNNQEDDDWCFKGKRYTNKKEYYQACHLCKVKANWYGFKKDTIKKENVLP